MSAIHISKIDPEKFGFLADRSQELYEVLRQLTTDEAKLLICEVPGGGRLPRLARPEFLLLPQNSRALAEEVPRRSLSKAMWGS